MNKSFDVFLSHNSKDKPAVRELAEALRARGLNVWLDEWELVPGRPWQEALEEIIETTRSAAVLVGRDGLGPWQDREMRSCLNEFVRRQLPVIPVLLPDTLDVPKLPIFLNEFTWVDLRGGLTEECLDRIEWGVTGKRLDRSKSLPALAAAPPISQAPDLLATLWEKSRQLLDVCKRYCLTFGYVARNPLTPLDRRKLPRSLGPAEFALVTSLIFYFISAVFIYPDPVSTFEIPHGIHRIYGLLPKIPLGVPLAFFILFFITSVIPFLSLRLFRLDISFRQTFSVYSYASPIQLLSAIVVLGAFIILDWWKYIRAAQLFIYPFWFAIVISQFANLARVSRLKCAAALMAGSMAFALMILPISNAIGPYGLFNTWQVNSGAMSPGVEPGDMLISNNLIYRFREPTLGELVVYSPPKERSESPFVGRVMGLPGDTVKIKGKAILINGEAIDDPWGAWNFEGCEELLPKLGALDSWVLKQEQYVIIMDNRCNAYDSRFTGPVLRSQIIGNIYFRYWPLKKLEAFTLST